MASVCANMLAVLIVELDLMLAKKKKKKVDIRKISETFLSMTKNMT